MKDQFDQLVREYNELLDSQKFVENELDYNLLKYHIPMLERLNVLSNSSISVFDMYKREHIYLSSNFEETYGWSNAEASEQGNDYFNSRVHPDDLIFNFKAGNYFLRLAFGLKPEDRVNKYKILSDYRVRNSRDEYVRVVEQKMLLEADKRGNIWLGLCIMDVSPDNDIESPARCRVINIKTGELYHFPPGNEENASKPALSEREKEVLNLISRGMPSKVIADKLCISVNTVNTHRQRIIEKLNVANTFEALRYGSTMGLIS